MTAVSEGLTFASYEQAESHWLNQAKYDYRKSSLKEKPRINPLDIVEELAIFYTQSGDERLKAAVDAIYEGDFITDEDFEFHPTSHLILRLAKNHEEKAIRIIRTLMTEGKSLRLAIASCAAQLLWPGNSFAAASKSLERLWRASTSQRR